MPLVLVTGTKRENILNVAEELSNILICPEINEHQFNILLETNTLNGWLNKYKDLVVTTSVNKTNALTELINNFHIDDDIRIVNLVDVANLCETIGNDKFKILHTSKRQFEIMEALKFIYKGEYT